MNFWQKIEQTDLRIRMRSNILSALKVDNISVCFTLYLHSFFWTYFMNLLLLWLIIFLTTILYFLRLILCMSVSWHLYFLITSSYFPWQIFSSLISFNFRNSFIHDIENVFRHFNNFTYIFCVYIAIWLRVQIEKQLLLTCFHTEMNKVNLVESSQV